MVVDFHRGYTHWLRDGAEVHVVAENVGVISLVVHFPDESSGVKVMLTPDEALQLATSLLREQNLERFGNG